MSSQLRKSGENNTIVSNLHRALLAREMLQAEELTRKVGGDEVCFKVENSDFSFGEDELNVEIESRNKDFIESGPGSLPYLATCMVSLRSTFKIQNISQIFVGRV